MAEAVSLAKVAADLQNYALDHKNYVVRRTIEIGFAGIPNSPVKPLAYYMNIMPADGEKVITDLLTVDPLQPGQKDTFDPKAYSTFKTRKAKPYPIKVDLLFGQKKIQALKDTYMSRVQGGQLDPEEVPFAQWMIDRLLPDVQKYMRVAIWKAALDANGDSSLDIFDGLVEQITDIITNTPADINVVSLTALTIDNCVTEFEKMAEALPTAVTYDENTVMIVTKAMKQLYEKAYRKAFGALPYNDEFRKVYLEGTNVELIVEPGIEGFNRPIITTKDNLTFLYDPNTMGNLVFDYDKRDRSIAWLMDFDAGAGIAASELLWVGSFA